MAKEIPRVNNASITLTIATVLALGRAFLIWGLFALVGWLLPAFPHPGLAVGLIMGGFLAADYLSRKPSQL